MTRFSSMRKKAEQQHHRFPIACRLCNAKHPIRFCPVFRAKQPIERLREALLGRYCANCLSMAHKLRNCTSEGRCRRCGENHHTMLHFDEEVTRRRSWSQQVADDDSCDGISLHASDTVMETRSLRDQEIGAETRTFRPAETRAETRPFRLPESGGLETRPLRPLLQHERRRKRGSETRPFRPQKKTVLVRRRKETREDRLATRSRQLSLPNTFRAGNLAAGQTLRPTTSISPTAVVKIEAGGRLHLVRALIDACSPCTIISSDLAKQLGLKINHVGGQRGCVLTMRGRNGNNKRVATHATVVRDYQRISPLNNVDSAVAGPYQHIRLADPRFFSSTPIRLVLGAELYSDIIMPGILPGSFGTLLAQSTIFGWVLSGVCI